MQSATWVFRPMERCWPSRAMTLPRSFSGHRRRTPPLDVEWASRRGDARGFHPMAIPWPRPRDGHRSTGYHLERSDRSARAPNHPGSRPVRSPSHRIAACWRPRALTRARSASGTSKRVASFKQSPVTLLPPGRWRFPRTDGFFNRPPAMDPPPYGTSRPDERSSAWTVRPTFCVTSRFLPTATRFSRPPTTATSGSGNRAS